MEATLPYEKMTQWFDHTFCKFLLVCSGDAFMVMPRRALERYRQYWQTSADNFLDEVKFNLDANDDSQPLFGGGDVASAARKAFARCGWI